MQYFDWLLCVLTWDEDSLYNISFIPVLTQTPLRLRSEGQGPYIKRARGHFHAEQGNVKGLSTFGDSFLQPAWLFLLHISLMKS